MASLKLSMIETKSYQLIKTEPLFRSVRNCVHVWINWQMLSAGFKLLSRKTLQHQWE